MCKEIAVSNRALDSTERNPFRNEQLSLTIFKIELASFSNRRILTVGFELAIQFEWRSEEL